MRQTEHRYLKLQGQGIYVSDKKFTGDISAFAADIAGAIAIGGFPMDMVCELWEKRKHNVAGKWTTKRCTLLGSWTFGDLLKLIGVSCPSGD
jgi:hypothetical protein